MSVNTRSMTVWLVAILVFLLAAGAGFARGAQEEVEEEPAVEPEVEEEVDERVFLSQFTRDQMWTYESLPSYSESPILADMVRDGRLPPVEQRLPRNPRVVKRNIMADGIGEYGGVWRDTYAVPNEGWNWAAGLTQGWFGINQILHEPLVVTGPMWMLEHPEPLPNLATDWEWSEDGYTLTMNLIEGARWSDGHPFTSDDVVFYYEDYILDPNVPSWADRSAWEYDGVLTELEQVDDYTIRWHFGTAFPIHAFYQMNYLNFSLTARHVYEPLHPRYNPDMDYTDFINATPPHDLPPVTLGPWVAVRHEAGEQLIMVRNPYFWQVDEEGNQLPYIDEMWFTEAASGEARTMNMVANEGDRDNIENPEVFGITHRAAQEPDAHFSIRFGPYGIGYRVRINLSTNLGVEDERDLDKRELFRTLEFRQALAHATDGDALADIAFPGPLTQGWCGGYPTGSSFHRDDLVTCYDHDLDEARRLLAGLGFEDTTGNGILNWPEGYARAGEELIIELFANEDAAAAVRIAEGLQPTWRRIGIDLRVRTMSGPAMSTRIDSGTFDLAMDRLDTAVPNVHMAEFGPIFDTSPDWHQAGPGGERDLLPFEVRIRELMQEARVTPDLDRQMEIFQEILALSTENVYSVGVYEVRRGLGLHNRIRNVQPDIPSYMYNWTIESMPVQIVYVPRDLQFNTRFTDLIPTEDDYTDRIWHR